MQVGILNLKKGTGSMQRAAGREGIGHGEKIVATSLFTGLWGAKEGLYWGIKGTLFRGNEWMQMNEWMSE